VTTFTPSCILFFALLAFVVSSWVVRRIRELLTRRGLIDHPNERSSHTIPTPRGGGMAITALTIAALVTGSLVSRLFQPRQVIGFVLAGLLIGTVSLIDDVHSLSARVRLIAQGLAAVMVMAACGYLSQVRFANDTIDLGFAGAALTLLWIVGLTNAYNFMDGIDGIAGAQALVAGLGWTTLGVLLGEPAPVLMGIFIAGSSAGFLVHNWPPARIFMGDVGSAFLGLAFASLPFLTRRGPADLFIPAVLLVWPFVFDTSLTFIRRLRRKENPFIAHRSHLYQRLNIAGFSHARVSTIYGLLAVLGAAAAIAFPFASGPLQLGLASSVVITGNILWFSVLHIERSR